MQFWRVLARCENPQCNDLHIYIWSIGASIFKFIVQKIFGRPIATVWLLWSVRWTRGFINLSSTQLFSDTKLQNKWIFAAEHENVFEFWIPITNITAESHKFSFQYKHDFIRSKYYSNDNNNINTKPRRSKTDLARSVRETCV